MHNPRILIASLLFTGLASTHCSVVRADTVLSNLGQTLSECCFEIGTSNPPTANLKRAQGFRTGANPQGYRLNSVTLGMGDSTGSGLGEFLLELHRIDSVISSTYLGDFLVTSNPTVASHYTYPFTDSSLVLLPMTNYSIVARSPASTGPTISQYKWLRADGTDATSLPDWAISGSYVAVEGETSSAPLRASAHQFAVDATAVPEPAGLLLMATAVVAALSVRGRGVA